MKDYGDASRKEIIFGDIELTPEARNRIKVERAKRILGERYILHPANYVSRLPAPTVDCSTARVLRS